MTDEMQEERARQLREEADTEGHGRSMQKRLVDEPEDTEGHGRSMQKRVVEEPEATDAEGHMFLSDTNAAREIARSRNTEIERAARERRLEKESRTNRKNG